MYVTTTSVGAGGAAATLRSCLGLRCDQPLLHLNGRSLGENEEEEDDEDEEEEDDFAAAAAAAPKRNKLTDLRPDQKEWLRTHLYRGDAALYACLVSPRNEGVEAAAWSWRCLQQAREKQSEVEE